VKQSMIGLMFFIALLNTAQAQAQKPAELRWCLGTFPGFYGFNAETRQPEGPSVEYMQEIANRARFKLIPSEETPSSRCFAQMGTGDTDLMINILKPSSGRPDIKYIQFAARWPDRVYHAARRKLRLDKPTQLATLSIATIRTYKAAAEIQLVLDSMKKRQLVQVDSVLTALQMAAKQRIDAAVLPPTQVSAVLKDHPDLAAELQEISFSVEQVKPQAVYMGLSSHCNCPETEAAITRSIQSMQADGSTDKIFAGKLISRF